MPDSFSNRPGGGSSDGADSERRPAKSLRVQRPKPVTTSLPLRDAPLPLVPPPPLDPAEEVMEKGLSESLNWVYRSSPWHQRTWELSQIWDQARRKILGLLESSFTEHQPRWMDPAWDDFNQARRQADAQGARYEDWVAAVIAATHAKDAIPRTLHGESAARAYAKYQPKVKIPEPRPETQDAPEGPPLSEQVAQIVDMAEKVYGDDPQAGAKLIKESIELGVLPSQALERLPRHLLMAYEQLTGDAPEEAPAKSSAPAGLKPSPKMIL